MEFMVTAGITSRAVRIADLKYPRYKIVVQCVVGQNKAQGVRVASRCLWDASTDNFASFSFKNVSGRTPHGRLSSRYLDASCPAHIYTFASYAYPCASPTTQDTLWCSAIAFGVYTE